jgi:hypothetical protein
MIYDKKQVSLVKNAFRQTVVLVIPVGHAEIILSKQHVAHWRKIYKACRTVAGWNHGFQRPDRSLQAAKRKGSWIHGSNIGGSNKTTAVIELGKGRLASTLVCWGFLFPAASVLTELVDRNQLGNPFTEHETLTASVAERIAPSERIDPALA